MDGITSPCADEYGNIGALVSKDEATKKAWVFPYKHRTQVYDIIPELDRHIHNVFHGKLKIIRTDNAPEFTGKAYESMRKTLAFTTQYSAAYEPAQNSEAERTPAFSRTWLGQLCWQRHQVPQPETHSGRGQ